MLDYDPSMRISPRFAREHRFMTRTADHATNTINEQKKQQAESQQQTTTKLAGLTVKSHQSHKNPSKQSKSWLQGLKDSPLGKNSNNTTASVHSSSSSQSSAAVAVARNTNKFPKHATELKN